MPEGVCAGPECGGVEPEEVFVDMISDFHFVIVGENPFDFS